MHKIVQIDGEALTIEDVVEVAYERAKVSIPEPVKARVNRSRQVLEELLEKGETIYSVNQPPSTATGLKTRQGGGNRQLSPWRRYMA